MRQRHHPNNNFQYEEDSTYNFGFREDVPLQNRTFPAFGVIQDQLFDWPKAPMLEKDGKMVMAPEYVGSQNPRPGVLGENGYGFSVIPDPTTVGFFGYGPNRLDYTLETIILRVLENGQVRAHMNFVAPNMTRFVDPIALGLDVADGLTLGAFSRFKTLLAKTLQRAVSDFAPVRLSLGFLNTATAGLSDDWFGYSWERVVKNVFGNHFNEAYDFFKQASVSWRLIPDWVR